MQAMTILFIIIGVVVILCIAIVVVCGVIARHGSGGGL